jgi:aerobic carbon-monoxide dehydrogenase medium subunit
LKPPPFDYAAPASVEEAVGMLTDEATDAKVLAGGQSLLPLLSMRLAYPDLLVDLRGIEQLDSIEHRGDTVVVGAMARQSDAERNHLLRELCPLVPEALRNVAHPQIRSRGTVGGSVAHADPAAELPAVVVALDATVKVAGPASTRSIAATDLYSTMLTTTLAEEEILTEVEIPVAPAGAGAACVEVARRAGDYAMCGAVAQVALADGVFDDVRLALFGISDTPVRIAGVESSLRGAEADPAVIVESTAACADDVSLMGSARLDEDYSRHLASVVAKRSLQAALERTS